MRAISDTFIEDLKNGTLRFVLDQEKKLRDKIPGLFVEIRKNAVSLYFLGQRPVNIREIGPHIYEININKAFLGNTQKNNWNPEWLVSELPFILERVIIHKKGKIAEGVVQDLYIKFNRTFPEDLVVLDNYVGVKGRYIDMVGVSKINDLNYLTLIELKAGLDTRIPEVINKQLIPYIDDVFANNDYYIKTYENIYKQKRELGLINQNKGGLIIQKPKAKKDIKGILILDGYNTRSKLLHILVSNIKRLENLADYDISLKVNSYVLKPYLQHLKNDLTKYPITILD